MSQEDKEKTAEYDLLAIIAKLTDVYSEVKIGSYTPNGIDKLAAKIQKIEMILNGYLVS